MIERSEKLFTTPIQYLKGIGTKRAEELNQVGIHTIGDLLQYYPRRYLDRSNITPIRKVRPNDTATVIGKIVTQGIKKGKRSRFIMVIADDTGVIHCVWFHQLNYWQKRFKEGQTIAVSGKFRYFGGLEIIHPEFDLLSEDGDDRDEELVNTGKIIPLYSSTESLNRVGLDSRGFRRVIRQLLANYGDAIREVFPQSVLQRHRLMPLSEAFQNIHFPADFGRLREAQRRLKFNELFLMEFLLAYRKHQIATQQKGIQFASVGARVKTLVDQLPFELTEAQKKVLREIRADMKSPRPMYRLLQGDVGSGKTIVALVSMLIAVENGYQAAMMAPTEILAEQHYLTFKRWLSGMGVQVRLLIGGQSSNQRNEVLKAMEQGDCDIVVGTHALIQDTVKFRRLGLVVIDEQHRFGVAQRAMLVEKGEQPDVLVMTATPIPRTLSLTIYGDLDVSILDEMPEGRIPVRTSWRYDNKRADIYQFVRTKVAEGRQAYIVFPLIEESEKLDLQAAIESYEQMTQGVFSGFKVALLHGRMSAEQKDAIMMAFKAGEIQILVSTTVIEVGVDVPNASIMVIENAERFGLTQLHQLRGRVGRGSEQSYCILIAKPPLTPEAVTRLNTMIQTTDGFKIAEVDLKLRGPGEFFGTRQHGLPELKIADPIEDGALLMEAREEAFKLAPNHAEFAETVAALSHNPLFQNYRDKLELTRIG